MPDSRDYGAPIAYLVLEQGTAVVASDHSPIGAVEHVLYVEAEDVFDGIVVQTPDGLRFVDRDDVDRIFERAVVTALTPDQARTLPPPDSSAPSYGVDPGDGIGPSLHDHYRRLFGKGRWKPS